MAKTPELSRRALPRRSAAGASSIVGVRLPAARGAPLTALSGSMADALPLAVQVAVQVAVLATPAPNTTPLLVPPRAATPPIAVHPARALLPATSTVAARPVVPPYQRPGIQEMSRFGGAAFAVDASHFLNSFEESLSLAAPVTAFGSPRQAASPEGAGRRALRKDGLIGRSGRRAFLAFQHRDRTPANPRIPPTLSGAR
ncbi:MAG: hypothetical protein IT305_15065 [Chloroflexi bacterium]|nr:hypothetical protein [Chloroflexota bacterium]